MVSVYFRVLIDFVEKSDPFIWWGYLSICTLCVCFRLLIDFVKKACVLCMVSVCFRLLIDYVEKSDPFVWRGYLYAVAMFLCSVTSVFFMHHAMNQNYTLGMRVRTALTMAIYKKVNGYTGLSLVLSIYLGF